MYTYVGSTNFYLVILQLTYKTVLETYCQQTVVVYEVKIATKIMPGNKNDHWMFQSPETNIN